jgi:hypothetical protein
MTNNFVTIVGRVRVNITKVDDQGNMEGVIVYPDGDEYLCKWDSNGHGLSLCFPDIIQVATLDTIDESIYNFNHGLVSEKTFNADAFKELITED